MFYLVELQFHSWQKLIPNFFLRWASIQLWLPRLYQSLYTKWAAQDSPSTSYWRKTICMLFCWVGLLSFYLLYWLAFHLLIGYNLWEIITMSDYSLQLVFKNIYLLTLCGWIYYSHFHPCRSGRTCIVALSVSCINPTLLAP